MSSLELKIPPPAVALLFALIMWLASLLGTSLDVPLGVRLVAAVALVLVGFSFSISGMVAFRRARTTINPFKPNAASNLVSRGVYRVTRNPMYLALLLKLLAWAVFLSSVLTLIFLPLFVAYINRFQITPEERALSSLFGSEFVEYKARVGRWL